MYVCICQICVPLYENVELQFIQKDIFLNLKSAIFCFVQKPYYRLALSS